MYSIVKGKEMEQVDCDNTFMMNNSRILEKDYNHEWFVRKGNDDDADWPELFSWCRRSDSSDLMSVLTGGSSTRADVSRMRSHNLVEWYALLLRNCFLSQLPKIRIKTWVIRSILVILTSVSLCDLWQVTFGIWPFTFRSDSSSNGPELSWPSRLKKPVSER
jgi:hypothetical protein